MFSVRPLDGFSEHRPVGQIRPCEMGYGRPDPSFATEPIPVRQVDHRESGETMRVVICGGGVIGACTAYFLSRRGVEVIVVERTGLANAASGKAGGFLALDWCAGTPLDALARRSFQLHAALREEIAVDWAYQRMNAYS